MCWMGHRKSGLHLLGYLHQNIGGGGGGRQRRGQVASTRRKRKPVKIIFMNDFDLGESRDNGTNFR